MMSNRLGPLMKELEMLSTEALDSIAELMGRLKDLDPERRYHLLERTAGALSSEQAGQLEAATLKCRRIDTSHS